MILNGAAIQAATTGFRAVFTLALESATPGHVGWMTEVPSSHSHETYFFPEMLGDMREWLGDRHIEALENQDFTIKNKTWEKTLAVKREAFEDDQLGLYNQQVQGLAASAAMHPDALMADLLTGGFSGLGYDGVAFFASTHPMKDGSTQSNIVSGALTETTFDTAVQRLLSMKNWAGKPIDPLALGGRLTLMVGPAKRAAAKAILDKEYIDGGDSNVNYKAADLQVFPRITGNHWFLGVKGGPVRPMLLQMRRKPAFVAQDQVRDDEMFHKNRVVFGVDGRWNAGYCLWQLIVGSTG